MSVRTAFEKARADGRSALVGYLPAGFPDVAGGIDALRAMVDSGCDVIEVGLPYSDPVMDGPTIQAAAQLALRGGVRTADVLRTVEAVAATGHARRGDDLLEPRRALRRGALRGRSRRRRRRGPDHPRPDARLRPRVVGRGRPARPRQDLPGRAIVDRRADRDDDRRLPRVRLRHCGDGRDRGPVDDQRPRRAARTPHARRCVGPGERPALSASGSASAPATRRPRWRRTPTA